MKNRIIEIVELGKPQSIIQREGDPITELIHTHILIEELNEQLLLYNVVGQSEQLSLCQCDKPSPDIMYGKTCAECCLDINPKA
jgi:hypothetical protein